MTYEITVLFDATAGVKVKAKTVEEAIDKAEDMAYGKQHLCHQCSNDLETGDIIGCHVYKNGKLIRDTTRAGELALLLADMREKLDAANAEIELLKGQSK